MFKSIKIWILKLIIKRALILEESESDLYLSLKEILSGDESNKGLEHIIQEEESHKKILTYIAEGEVSYEQLEEIFGQHHFLEIQTIEPLDKSALSKCKSEILKALRMEEDRFNFYNNLSKISKIPPVKKAFHLLADMEREHLEILKRLLGI